MPLSGAAVLYFPPAGCLCGAGCLGHTRRQPPAGWSPQGKCVLCCAVLCCAVLCCVCVRAVPREREIECVLCLVPSAAAALPGCGCAAGKRGAASLLQLQPLLPLAPTQPQSSQLQHMPPPPPPLTPCPASPRRRRPQITLTAAPFSNAAGALAAHPTIILKSQGLGRKGHNLYRTTFADAAQLSFPLEAVSGGAAGVGAVGWGCGWGLWVGRGLGRQPGWLAGWQAGRSFLNGQAGRWPACQWRCFNSQPCLPALPRSPCRRASPPSPAPSAPSRSWPSWWMASCQVPQLVPLVQAATQLVSPRRPACHRPKPLALPPAAAAYYSTLLLPPLPVCAAVAGSGGSQGLWTLTVADVAPNNTL